MIFTVNPKEQVTIPEPPQRRYGFSPGTKVVRLECDGDLIPKPVLSIEQLCGRINGSELTGLLLEERARDRKPWKTLVNMGEVTYLVERTFSAGAASLAARGILIQKGHP